MNKLNFLVFTFKNGIIPKSCTCLRFDAYSGNFCNGNIDWEYSTAEEMRKISQSLLIMDFKPFSHSFLNFL